MRLQDRVAIVMGQDLTTDGDGGLTMNWGQGA